LKSLENGKPSGLDVARCLLFMPPTKFIRTFREQLRLSLTSVAINMDTARNLAVCVLATPYTPHAAPLLPIFFHSVFPAIVDTMDSQQPVSPQPLISELLASVLATAIMFALHLERAMTTLNSGELHYPLGEQSAVMARGIMNTLRHRKQSANAKLIAQRLASSKTLVTNFPVFKAEM
jgi:mediator of RNA polymerase II transcription subunit 5